MTPMGKVGFRRVGRIGTQVIIDSGGTMFYLPNPTPQGRTYDPAKIAAAVINAGEVDLDHWVPYLGKEPPPSEDTKKAAE